MKTNSLLLFTLITISISCSTAHRVKDSKFHFSAEVVEPTVIAHPHKAVIIFSGFPSYYTRNADFAFVLAARMEMRTFIYDYKGLRQSSGSFSLLSSIKNAQESIENLAKKYNLKEVYVIGHSWGGLVALNVMRKHPELVRKAFLMAPLLTAQKSKNFEVMFRKIFLVQNKLNTQFVRASDLLSELPKLINNHLPMSFAKELKGPIAIIHSKTDKVIPFSSSATFAKIIGPFAEVHSSGKTHWLSHNRPGLMRQAQAFFEKD